MKTIIVTLVTRYTKECRADARVFYSKEKAIDAMISDLKENEVFVQYINNDFESIVRDNLEQLVYQLVNEIDLDVEYTIEHHQIEHSRIELSDYLETHYEIAIAIEEQSDKHPNLIPYIESEGTGFKWSYAQALTEEFQELHKDTIWGDFEHTYWIEAIEEFIQKSFDNLK
jgi:hypothetical protein